MRRRANDCCEQEMQAWNRDALNGYPTLQDSSDARHGDQRDGSHGDDGGGGDARRRSHGEWIDDVWRHDVNGGLPRKPRTAQQRLQHRGKIRRGISLVSPYPIFPDGRGLDRQIRSTWSFGALRHRHLRS